MSCGVGVRAYGWERQHFHFNDNEVAPWAFRGDGLDRALFPHRIPTRHRTRAARARACPPPTYLLSVAGVAAPSLFPTGPGTSTTLNHRKASSNDIHHHHHHAHAHSSPPPTPTAPTTTTTAR